jgi:polysaccharide export outer membrane protein
MLATLPISAHSQSTPPRQAGDSAGLAPGDLIAVTIWREPDLSDTVQVDNAGIAVLPKLGPLTVTGISPDSLQRRLVTEYSQYLQNPSIRITALRRITVWGAVVKPGPYPVDLTMSVTDAVALAGGPTGEGKTDKVELRRGSKRYMIDLSGRTPGAAGVPLRSGDQLVVPEKAWLSRNFGLVIGAIGVATSLVYLVRR